jgi:peptidoglycan/xylan/chitin deacetylase (PgdA/CDA1 family)
LNKTKRIITAGLTVVVLLAALSLAGLIIKDYQELSQPGVIVLLYHRITTKTAEANKYTLSMAKFQQQMDYLKKEGYITILPQDIVNKHFTENNPGMVILSFDDGTADHFAIVYPLLKQNGQRGVFFVVAGLVNSPGALTAKQVRQMNEGGMEIGSHSYSHPLLDQLGYEKVGHELTESKESLEKIIGEKIYSFAPPGGWYNENVVRAARSAGYDLFFGCEIGSNDLSRQPSVYKRTEVLGDMSFDQFKDLLHPQNILMYKIKQSIKFVLHNIIGSKNYARLSRGI